MIQRFALAIILIVQVSCLNYTKTTSNICPIHNIKMKKCVKRMVYGFIANDGNTADYPFGSNFQSGGCVKGAPYCIGYVCPQCRKTKQQTIIDFYKFHKEYKH